MRRRAVTAKMAVAVTRTFMATAMVAGSVHFLRQSELNRPPLLPADQFGVIHARSDAPDVTSRSMARWQHRRTP